jgi:hypothetical protein
MTLRVLIDANAGVNIADACGNSKLHVAIETGSLRSVKILLEADALANVFN